jgi:hypothetical protein
MFPFLQPQHRNHTTRNLPMFSNRVRNHPPEYIGHCWQMTLWNLGATNDEAGSSTLSWTSWHGHAVVSKLPARRLWIYDLIVSPPGFEFPRCRTSCNCQQSMARSAQSLQLVVQTAVTRSDGVVERDAPRAPSGANSSRNWNNAGPPFCFPSPLSSFLFRDSGVVPGAYKRFI